MNIDLLFVFIKFIYNFPNLYRVLGQEERNFA